MAIRLPATEGFASAGSLLATPLHGVKQPLATLATVTAAGAMRWFAVVVLAFVAVETVALALAKRDVHRIRVDLAAALAAP